MNLFTVAYRLHKTVEEIGEMSVAEFLHWCAFFKIIAPKRKP